MLACVSISPFTPARLHACTHVCMRNNRSAFSKKTIQTHTYTDVFHFFISANPFFPFHSFCLTISMVRFCSVIFFLSFLLLHFRSCMSTFLFFHFQEFIATILRFHDWRTFAVQIFSGGSKVRVTDDIEKALCANQHFCIRVSYTLVRKLPCDSSLVACDFENSVRTCLTHLAGSIRIRIHKYMRTLACVHKKNTRARTHKHTQTCVCTNTFT